MVFSSWHLLFQGPFTYFLLCLIILFLSTDSLISSPPSSLCSFIQLSPFSPLSPPNLFSPLSPLNLLSSFTAFSPFSLLSPPRRRGLWPTKGYLTLVLGNAISCLTLCFLRTIQMYLYERLFYLLVSNEQNIEGVVEIDLNNIHDL